MDQIDKGYCEIKVKGKLAPRWGDWFDLMEVSSDDRVTIISGMVQDQAALQGLMEKMSMLGMTILSIDFKSTVPDGDFHLTIQPSE